MPLSEILVAANVPPQQVDHLVNEGWTTEHFALCASSLEEFDTVISEVLEVPLSHLHKSALRLAWRNCQPSAPTATSDTQPLSGGVESTGQVAAGSWSETFAPKLTTSNVSSLKATFKRNYPAEVLLPENAPSLRLLSMVVHQKQKSDYHFPWKFRLTALKSDEITAAKPQKVARAEGLHLHSILMDEPPAMEVANGAMGLHAIRNLQFCDGYG